MMSTSVIRAFLPLLLVSASNLGVGAETQHVVVSAATQRMPEANGGSLRADWVGSFESSILSLGASRTDVGQDHWTLMSLGTVKSYPRGWKLAGSMDYGPAALAGESETFARAQVRLIFPVVHAMTFRVQETFVDVRPLRGHLLSGGWHLAQQSTDVDLEWSRSVSGNLDERTMALRFDLRNRPPYLMLGVAHGKSNNRLLLNLPNVSGVTQVLRQAFIGLTFPVGSKELTLVMERAKVGEVRRIGVSASVRMPFGRPR